MISLAVVAQLSCASRLLDHIVKQKHKILDDEQIYIEQVLESHNQ